MRLICADCGAQSDELAKCWRAYHAVEELTDDEYLLSFCPECATREFGSSRRPHVGERDTA